ncbi:MAG: thymidylate synthase [Patescibacteria group bacterium]|nr:thymidylate synthase [Patescibacteria group bacterium]
MNRETEINWPVYKDKMLILGNPNSQVAICTLWTDKEFMTRKLDLEKVSVIGNLYSPKRGISFLIRNILANPKIRYLIVCGLDTSKSGQVLVDLAANGFEKIEDKKNNRIYWRVISNTENRIDIEIEEEAIEDFRKGVEIIDLRQEKDYNEIKKIINNLDQNLSSFVPNPLLFPDPPEEKVNIFPSEPSAHIIRGEKIAEVWLRILDHILRFGITDQTAYQNLQKEIIDIISVISGEDPNDLYIPEWLPYDREHLEDYLPTILTGNCPSGISYTYGSRMRKHFNVDQVQNVIDELKNEKYSRRATISLLDPKVDAKSKNPPCLNHCWFRIQRDKLYLIATIRSNDMFEAWPENAFGLRMLQDLVWKELMETYPEIELGDLVIHSFSAHEYDDSWEDAKQVVKKYYNQIVPRPRSVRDPRGNFIIRVEDDEIIVEHYSPDEVLLNTYKNKEAMPIYLEMSRDNAISVISHALYIGTELQKAETVIKFGIKYEQDKKINWR